MLSERYEKSKRTKMRGRRQHLPGTEQIRIARIATVGIQPVAKLDGNNSLIVGKDHSPKKKSRPGFPERLCCSVAL
jgi:hypothetical protein